MSDQPDPTAGHSPLPWAWGLMCDGSRIAYVTSGQFPVHGMVAQAISPSDAAHIVREVNEAPKLRAEVERLRRRLADAHASWDGRAQDVTPCDCNDCQTYAALNPEDPSDG